ncbi:dihydrolipoyl dehydrogenase [Rickettsiales endosymbiont of Stachyamoeba lipophora]|uniref:dihydrolipoyl dehydrogenase n=1 Tax=Rickettsiales endosymbiont of Stachyamoeba lipophora TaxID=2486578 RepID=UPI000F64A17C|nr:dihydrolipoyl dehydrogenase [Rickettsiales endosymbiont of Stachyamoeba lipophora]AZL16152.1 dihydrolipoyl dehydrogenase [Rickettsiales endosymbiont of Stachyamoeba lipophora]
MAENFDVVVIGAGPGGYVAAIRAAQLGLKTAIVEANHLGGICLNWGCIPTKALLRSAEIFHYLQHADEFGLKAEKVSFDITKIVERSRNVAKQLSTGIGHLLKKNKVTVIDGFAKILKNKQIEVSKDGRVVNTLQAKNIIIATGARAKVIPGFEPDGKLILTYKEAMVPTKMPKSMIVVGSGAIGVEFANFYNALGAKVTILEAMDRILLTEDTEIAQMAHKAYEKQGITIHTNVSLKKFEKGKDNVKATFEINGKQEQLTVDNIIMAIGVVANSENIGLENTKVKVDNRNSILTNPYLQTDDAGIYAIGDVASAPWLAHKASHEGIIAAEHIAGLKPHPMKKENIPGCIYTHPQIASIGITESKAKELGLSIKVGKFPAMANGKAIAMGEPEGLVKTIFDAKTGELLGAHMIGAEVTEMIQGYAIAKTMEGTEEDLMHTVFPHPTMSEMMHESVLAAYGRAIHF